MQQVLQTIQSGFDDNFGNIDFPMILTDEEIYEVKYRSAKAAIEKANYRRKVNDIKNISALSINNEWEVDHVIEYFRVDIASDIEFANRMKHGEIRAKEWAIKLKEIEKKKKEEIESHWTAEQMYRLMKLTAAREDKELIYDESNALAIEALCYFCSDDVRFETKLGYSRQKGIILMGGYGTGKTYLPTLLKDNDRNPIQINSMIKIEHEVRNKGSFDLKLSDKHITYLDDVGTESENQKHFGNEINWFQEWIELMYSEQMPFNRLIISTNLNIDGLEQKYTGRVRSRLAEKMNVIILDGSDRRKNNL